MPKGKPVAVDALVVREDPVADVAQPGVREDARADLRVAADLGPLVGVERVGLVQQHVRDRDVADVVQQPREADALDGGLVEPDLGARSVSQ